MARAGKKRKKLWLRRCHYGSWVHLYNSVNAPNETSGRGFLYDFCPAKFKRITGISLKPGEVREVRSLKIELVEERGKISEKRDRSG